MNKLYFILIAIGLIFIAGKFVYDMYGEEILSKLHLPSVKNPNGLQAGSVQRTSEIQ